MKILVVVPNTNWGGITTSITNFSNEMVEEGHQLVFLDMSGLYKCGDNLSDRIYRGHLSGKARYWNLGKETLKKSHGLKKVLLSALGVVKKIAIRLGLWYSLVFNKYKEYGEFDVAIAFRQCASCYSFVLGKVKAKKKLGFVHGELRHMGDISSWRKYLTKFNKVAYVSEVIKEGFVAAYPELADNAVTIYNMLDTARIEKMAEQKNPCEFDRCRFNIITVTRVENTLKCVDRIPHICDRLKKLNAPDFHWYVVGDGPDFDATVRLARSLDVTDVLTFTGATENPFCILKDADICVQTSKTEAYSMVLIESLFLNVPIFAARYPSLGEILKDGENGIVCEQDNRDIADKLLAAMRGEIDIQKMKSALQKSKKTNEKQYLQFLNAIG